MTEQNYYRLTIPQFGEYYEYGATALEAILTTREAFAQTARNLGRYPQPLGAITARPAAYKEWNYGTDRYRNDGSFIR